MGGPRGREGRQGWEVTPDLAWVCLRTPWTRRQETQVHDHELCTDSWWLLCYRASASPSAKEGEIASQNLDSTSYNIIILSALKILLFCYISP